MSINLTVLYLEEIINFLVIACYDSIHSKHEPIVILHYAQSKLHITQVKYVSQNGMPGGSKF